MLFTSSECVDCTIQCVWEGSWGECGIDSYPQLPHPFCQIIAPSLHSRGLSVGIYPTNSPEACQYILDNCKANVCVVENQKQLDKVLQIWERLPHLKAVVQYTGKLSQRYNNVYEVGVGGEGQGEYPACLCMRCIETGSESAVTKREPILSPLL